MDQSLQDMTTEIPSDEMGELRCSDLEVPMFEIKAFTDIARTYLHDLTQFQWNILAKDCIDQGTIRILSNMLFDLVNATIEVVYEEVAPQVQDMLCNSPVPDPQSESPLERNYTTVTEDDIHASIGDSLHHCFGEIIDERQRRSEYSDKLTELFVAEVARGVNWKLADITSCTRDLPQTETFTVSDVKIMVYYVSCIFSLLLKKGTPSSEDSQVMSKRNVSKIPQDQEYPSDVLSEVLTPVLGNQGSALSDESRTESSDDLQHKLDTGEIKEISSLLVELRSVPSGGDVFKAQECLDGGCCEGSCPDEVKNTEVFNAEDDADTESVPEDDGPVLSDGHVKAQECLDGGCCEASCPDKGKNVEVLNAEDAEEIDAIPDQQGSILLEDRMPDHASSTKESIEQEKSVLTAFLGNLLTQIAKKAKTPKFDVDFDGMVERLHKNIAGQITSPQNVENAHIPVYKELCRMFGSAKMLQAAVETREAIFIDAVARTLEVQLHKSPRKKNGLATRLKKFFRVGKTKINPSCEINTTEHHSDLINLETPPKQKKEKRPAIERMFRILCWPFISCISDRSQD